MYTGNPLNNPIDALRLEFGDIDPDFPRLCDSAYQYYINRYPDSPKKMRRDIGMAILASLTSGVRERSGQEERYGNEEFKNYRDWLDRKINDQAFMGLCPLIYVGGVSREIVQYYEENPDFIDAMFFKGYQSRKPVSQTRRKQDIFGLSNPEERNKRCF